ncbi:zinc ribbon domain-containing protein [Paenibacillus monticola]|uniref:Zinc ribbon domain-containing protein n=1 Tax=Paenibacillus monticola TaxID=2666075 RepID=A0A7X2L3N6_9BACL|nr:zinc ribbon domain-containing protein [Paenibacillus monticola]MRN55463.1 zinc ribbon domain-containing protein [Paenibacillus monticola]
MNLIQRIKDGANRVSEKAQNSVEVGKLNGHISDIEREMEIEFVKMGKLFYEGYRSRDMSVAEGKMVELSRTCNKLQEKIEGLRSRIAELKNERLCTCGYVVALNANFCPNCGRKLEEPVTSRKVPPTPVTVQVVPVDEDEDQYYGADELTDEEKELAMRPEQQAAYAEVLKSDVEQPIEDYTGNSQDSERGRRQADELERERERQLELDRRIRDWQATEHVEEAADSESDGVRELVKCQICRADLPKGSMWCSRCGSEQI